MTEEPLENCIVLDKILNEHVKRERKVPTEKGTVKVLTAMGMRRKK